MRPLVIALVLAVSSLAGAEPAKRDEPKNPGLAVLLSAGITLVGFGTTADSLEWGPNKQTLVGLTLMYLGPSTGRWYANNPGLSGLGLRAAGAAAIMYGLSTGALSVCDEPGRACDQPALGKVAVVAGAGLWIGSTIADIVFAHGDARDYNARHLSLAPVRMQTASGDATGLALTGRF